MPDDPGIRFEAVLFDFDGTLVDSERHYARVLAELMTRDGHDIDADTALDVCFGRSWSDIFLALKVGWPGAFASTEALVEQVEQAAAGADGVIGEPITDSIDMLHRLAETTRVCIVTGASRAHASQVARQLGFDRPLEFILGCEDYSPGKPDPTPFRQAAQRLGVTPDRCVVFEDSPAGVASAKAAGMACVRLVPDGTKPDADEPADLVVQRLSDASLWRFLTQAHATPPDARPA